MSHVRKRALAHVRNHLESFEPLTVIENESEEDWQAIDEEVGKVIAELLEALDA